MSARDAPFSTTLSQWLDRLNTADFDVGVRERLVVHELLARLAATGELPAEEHAALALLAPLLCTSPQAQRRYTQLLAEFVALKPREREPRRGLQPPTSAEGKPESAQRRGRRTRGIGLSLLALLALLAALFVWLRGQSVSTAPGGQTAIPLPPPPASSSPETATQPIYVPIRALQIQQSPHRPAWASAVLPTLLTAGFASALLLALVAWRRGRQALYLRGICTDAAVHQRLLSDAAGTTAPTAWPQVRSAARGMRQRLAGEREALDLAATLKATVHAAGAFSPRWLRLPQTPEYLVLIDRRHPMDLFAAQAEAWVRALDDQGVAVQAWYFEGSAASGCWRLRPGPRGRQPVDRTTVSRLAARLGGARLLVFSDARCLLDPLRGGAAAWTREFGLFPQRSWLTPVPMASWGEAEHLADALGFLVLPLQPESLDTLANWLSAGELSMEIGDDWPPPLPSLLARDDLHWVARQSAPPQDVLDDVMLGLRSFLGSRQFQWMCGCAIFPALSPPLTLALGRVLDSHPRRLARGAAALAALPWFRYGRMPGWLRTALLQHLSAPSEQAFRKAIEQRLATALEGMDANLATLAVRRRLHAWLARGRGLARDVVMVEFLRTGRVSRLAMKLPEALRMRLFRNGTPTHGLRAGVLLAFMLLALLPILGLTDAGRSILAPAEVQAIPLRATLTGPAGDVMAVAFSPDGRRIGAGSSDNKLHLWSNASSQPWIQPVAAHERAVLTLAFSPDGSHIATGSHDGTVKVWNLRNGQLENTLRGHQDSVSSVAYSPDGRRIASGSKDKTIRLWDAGTGRQVHATPTLENWVWQVAFSPDGAYIASAGADGKVRIWNSGGERAWELEGHQGAVWSVAFSRDGRRIVSGGQDGTVRRWDAARPTLRQWNFNPAGKPIGAPLQGHAGPVWSVAVSPDGRYIVSGGEDRTVRLWDAVTGAPVGSPLRDHVGTVFSVVFSPDGGRIASGSGDGTVRLWGAPVQPALDLVGCKAGGNVDADTVKVADAVATQMAETSVVAYTPDAWRLVARSTLPAPRTVEYEKGNASQQRLAESLTNLLPGQGAGAGWSVQAAPLGMDAVAVNLCGRPATLVPTRPPTLRSRPESFPVNPPAPVVRPKAASSPSPKASRTPAPAVAPASSAPPPTSAVPASEPASTAQTPAEPASEVASGNQAAPPPGDPEPAKPRVELFSCRSQAAISRFPTDVVEKWLRTQGYSVARSTYEGAHRSELMQANGGYFVLRYRPESPAERLALQMAKGEAVPPQFLPWGLQPEPSQLADVLTVLICAAPPSSNPRVLPSRPPGVEKK